ncbi:hypothetical protein [Nonomuraea sp. NPDC052265]|uniref:hypothetical protein n=1 Tax=Nonomuraea sp. NPDC052265 TaxID=3364374 RepID=UPI0037C5B804
MAAVALKAPRSAAVMGASGGQRYAVRPEALRRNLEVLLEGVDEVAHGGALVAADHDVA